MSRALPRRRAEFAGGRAAARLAMAGLGRPPTAVPVGPHRQPIWPAGVRGSITHDGDLAMAVVADAVYCRGIGVDMVEDDGVDEDLWGLVLTDAERGRLLSGGPGDRRLASFLFAAKEASFKAQFGLTGLMLDFHDTELDLGTALDRSPIATTARIPSARAPGAGSPLRLRIVGVRAEGRWWALAWVGGRDVGVRQNRVSRPVSTPRSSS